MHLTKILTLVAIKMEEKFPTLAKAFLFFDVDDDRQITRTEFAKGVEGLRVKLSKEDVDKVFDYLDKDKDQSLDYYEFCGLSEEKRRNIDPFESYENLQGAKSLRPSDASLGIIHQG
jgi:Ca2+-binding EF-hand superfamily protein